MERAFPIEPLYRAEPLEHRAAELTILYEVSRALQKISDEEKALYAILIGVTHGRRLGFDRAVVLLVNSRSECLEGRLSIWPSSADDAAVIWLDLRERHQTIEKRMNSLLESETQNEFGASSVLSHFRIPLYDQENLLLKIMLSQKPGLSAGGRFEPHGFPVPSVLPDWLDAASFAAAPLYLTSEDLGLLIADNGVTHRPVDIPNLKLLQIYAQQASIAIENIRLYRALKEKIALCERTNQVLKENQSHLLQAERLSTIGKMAATLAHEIRTPLVSIGGFTRRMLRATSPDDPRKEEMDIIVSEVSRLEKMVTEVLGYGKLSQPEFKPVDVNHLVQSVLLMVADETERHSVRTVLHLDPLLCGTEADESQLRQALLNLVTNSMEAMPSGGVLEIATTLDRQFFEISVRDTGVGITREDFGKLFTPFFTTKINGTGLGLSVVSQVADNHNGSLRFESTPNQGTIFQMRLALHPAHPPER